MEPVTIPLGGWFTVDSPFVSNPGTSPPLSYLVPSNKRLTIESVTGSAAVPKGQSTFLQLLVLKPNVGVPVFTLALALAYQVCFPTFTFCAAHNVCFYPRFRRDDIVVEAKMQYAAVTGHMD